MLEDRKRAARQPGLQYYQAFPKQISEVLEGAIQIQGPNIQAKVIASIKISCQEYT